jgi:hypothetical protein
MFVKGDQRRQKPRQCFASAGRRDQQRVLTRPRRIQHGKLMRPGRPSLAGEPPGKRFRQCSRHDE